MSQTWLSARALAELQLPGVPHSRERCSTFIHAVNAQEPRATRRRAGRGGGLEISIAALPPAARAALADMACKIKGGAPVPGPRRRLTVEDVKRPASLPRVDSGWPEHFARRRRAILEQPAENRTILSRLWMAELVVRYADFASVSLADSVRFWATMLCEHEALHALSFVVDDRVKPSPGKARQKAARHPLPKPGFVLRSDLRAVRRACFWRGRAWSRPSRWCNFGAVLRRSSFRRLWA